jgi:hypothetical protein
MARGDLNVRDHCGDIAADVVARNGDGLHSGWIYSHPTGDRDHRDSSSGDSGPQADLAELGWVVFTGLLFDERMRNEELIPIGN